MSNTSDIDDSGLINKIKQTEEELSKIRKELDEKNKLCLKQKHEIENLTIEIKDLKENNNNQNNLIKFYEEKSKKEEDSEIIEDDDIMDIRKKRTDKEKYGYGKNIRNDFNKLKKYKIYFYLKLNKDSFIFQVQSDFLNVSKQYVYELIKNIVKKIMSF